MEAARSVHPKAFIQRKSKHAFVVTIMSINTENVYPSAPIHNITMSNTINAFPIASNTPKYGNKVSVFAPPVSSETPSIKSAIHSAAPSRKESPESASASKATTKESLPLANPLRVHPVTDGTQKEDNANQPVLPTKSLSIESASVLTGMKEKFQKVFVCPNVSTGRNEIGEFAFAKEEIRK